MSIAGHFVGVTTNKFGSELTADLAVGDTVVQVASTIFFNERWGGTLLLNGVKLDYAAFDDPDTDDPDAGDDDGPTTLTLTAESTVAASDGTRVYEFDPTTGEDDPVQELRALVTIDDRDAGDALTARVRAGLVDQLDSDWETYVGKAVELHGDRNGLVLVDILGSKATGQQRGSQDGHVATSSADLTFNLTYQPVPDSTVHLWWNGVPQEDDAWSIDGWTITVDDPDGLAEAGDRFYVKYLYTDPALRPIPPPIPASLTLVGSAHRTNSGDIALPAGTQEGDLLVLALVGRDITFPATTADTRISSSYSDMVNPGSPSFNGFMGYGFEDGSGAAVTVSFPSGWAELAVFRVTGALSDVHSPVAGNTTPTTMPDPAADMGIAVLIGVCDTGGDGPFVSDSTGAWTTVSPGTDSGGVVNSGKALMAYCTTGTPDGSWAGLTSGAKRASLVIGMTDEVFT